MDSCLYVGPNLAAVAIVTEPGLAATTDRHKVPLRVPALTTNVDPLAELDRRGELLGVIIGMERGWAGSSHLRFASRVLKRGRRVWFHWPEESAVECIDRERLASCWRHWAFITGYRLRRRVKNAFSIDGPQPDPGPELADRCAIALREFAAAVRPVPFAPPPPGSKIPGLGAYLRTDYWVAITSGGSYGHTCYVAKELAATTERFICLTAHRYPLLDEFGLQQVVMPKASDSASEVALLGTTWHYYPILEVAFEALRPAYIYERLCLGNFAGALLSRELGIPYIVEYNGSEISLSKSFGSNEMFYYEDVFLRAEHVAFQQATMITVVSQVLKDSLVARGVDPAKILVNPNGADPDAYAPPRADVRQAIRGSLGFTDSDRVVGFSGTFGGWHGIDVLAAAIPQVCARAPAAKFLLIGDGANKPVLDETVSKAGLDARVKSVGRVPQSEGARLLGACDLFVSPHNRHMVDSRFFGSPTKLFEYMSVGRGIVGSDLEQLGEVLSPALRSADFARGEIAVTDERAVLCTPGDVDQFVDAVVGLVERPAVSDALGRNARQAILDHYSWRRHVQNVWGFLRTPGRAPLGDARVLDRVDTGDAYKEEIQNQWNNNPVGTQYASATRPHTLEWFKEIEAYRYGVYAPWMPELMELSAHAGHDVLEIGAGVGTDLSRFAQHGARVTDVDLSAGHLEHAKENFALRGLTGRFVHHDAETLPFPDNSFDLVYSNGVLHHTPNTAHVVGEIRRVLRPGGRAIIMMYAENSFNYWYWLVWHRGLHQGLLKRYSMGEIMSRYVEITKNEAKPLVKVYTARRLRTLFKGFAGRVVYKRQLTSDGLPGSLQFLPLDFCSRIMGWNVIIKATKPRA